MGSIHFQHIHISCTESIVKKKKKKFPAYRIGKNVWLLEVVG